VDIGEQQKTIYVEPVKTPVPAREPKPAKEPVRVPAKPEREKVPAGV
jgi:hypothetical protein